MGVRRNGNLAAARFIRRGMGREAPVLHPCVAYAQHGRLRGSGDGPGDAFGGSKVAAVDESWVNELLDPILRSLVAYRQRRDDQK